MKKEIQTVSLEATIKICLEHPELLQQYKRLNPLKVYATDKKNKREFEKWSFELFNFIRDYIWWPTQIQPIVDKIKKS